MASSSSFMSAERTPAALRIQDHHPALYGIVQMTVEEPHPWEHAFPMSGLNNVDIADRLSQFRHTKGLDAR
jgi:hypothetical protein